MIFLIPDVRHLTSDIFRLPSLSLSHLVTIFRRVPQIFIFRTRITQIIRINYILLFLEHELLELHEYSLDL